MDQYPKSSTKRSNKRNKSSKSRRNKQRRLINEEVNLYYEGYNNSFENYDDEFSQIHNYYVKEPVNIKPKNDRQKKYLKMLNSNDTTVVVTIGPAGTGKTLLATETAIQHFQNNNISRIIVTRPAVSVDEQHGFLPGTLDEKMDPWVRPLYDIFEKHYNSKEMDYLRREKQLEIVPLAYMRGRTFENTWILADEMQNSTPSQMKMLLTRVGNGSKLVITGDIQQHDRGFEQNGLSDLWKRLTRQISSNGIPKKEIQIMKFHGEDVERHPVVRMILDIYDDNKPIIDDSAPKTEETESDISTEIDNY